MTVPHPTSDSAAVAAACRAAEVAAPWLAARTPSERAALLETIADAVDGAIDSLVAVAMRETSLTEARLRGEVGRTTGQLRLFAAVLRDGACFEVILDRARPDLTPPRPDLRRWLIGLGPVAVFSASNFPFAFSTLGGDTASALAAGCPVVLKAHPGHPETTTATAAVALAALASAGAPEGVFAVVGSELETGVALVQDPRITAVAFTGSTHGGMALARLCAERPVPIPFFGELGSINPVFVTRAAADARGAQIAAGFVESFTLGTGQFCTKPGLLIVPRGSALRDAAITATAAAAGQPMLNERIRTAFSTSLGARMAAQGVEVLHPGQATDVDVTPTLLSFPASALLEDVTLFEECFGPSSILIEYDDESVLPQIARRLPGTLTVTVHAEGDEPVLGDLLPLLQDRTGRLLWNGWPTGVAVTWSMTHGGPFPATNTQHTSVGATAIRRFQRPVTYQAWPHDLLPAALRDENPWGLPRRVDGTLELA